MKAGRIPKQETYKSRVASLPPRTPHPTTIDHQSQTPTPPREQPQLAPGSAPLRLESYPPAAGF